MPMSSSSPGRSLRFLLGSILCLPAVCFESGCGSGVDADQAAAIQAPLTALRVSQTVQLATNTVITQSPLTFYVNGVAGGNAEVGTISSNGLYTAPDLVPHPGNVVTITSVAPDYPNGRHGMVKLSILNPVPVAAAVLPGSLTEGTITLFVNGSNFLYGSAILWNGTAVPTTYVNGKELVAVVSAPKPGTYLVAVRNPDPGSADSATLSEAVGPGQVVITLGVDPTIRVDHQIQLAAEVTGTQNTGLNWFVNGTATGNADIGTISVDASGTATYKAPTVVPTPKNIVTLTAVSVDDPKVSASWNLGILNPIPVLQTASPASFSPGVTTVVLSGSRFLQGATAMVNGKDVPTTFVSGTELTASLDLASAGTVDLQVRNPSPGAATSADLLAGVNGTEPVPAVSPENASRLLGQATFGATDADIHHLSTVGYDAWLNEQIALPGTSHEPYVEGSILIHNPACASGDIACYTTLFTADANRQYIQQSFWHQAVAGNDQLRQRMVYTWTEMMVISYATGVSFAPRGMASYYDVLGNDTFGNFRQLLEDVTLHPMMGQFLSMLGNDKGDANRDPDENYAREVMQLFTIGLYQLNPDGTKKLDGTGQPIPTYSNNDVMGLAKVFTGFSWNVPNDTSEATWYNCCTSIGPGFGAEMRPMRSYPSHHSTAEKDFLGVTIPAGANPDPDGDLKIALDTLFNHPNLPPFVCKQLIQHLVTSNPSPAYVGRVAAVFQDNGFGVRGDLKAVIRAILLDDEARNATAAGSNAQFGKVREALLRYTNWARAFSAQSRTGVYTVGDTSSVVSGLGEMSLAAPSVFNWFAPGFVPPGTDIEKAGLVAPELQMTNITSVASYLNYMQDAIGAADAGGQDLFSAYSPEIALAQTPDKLLDRVNLLLMAGQMSPSLRQQVLDAVNSIAIPAGSPDAAGAALKARVQVAIYLTVASPAYIAQF